MEISNKSHFKLRAYLNFSLEGRANLILNLEKLRNLFRKISKFCAMEKQNTIEKFNPVLLAQPQTFGLHQDLRHVSSSVFCAAALN